MSFDPSPDLADDVLLQDVVLPTRLRNVFRFNVVETVGDLRATSDATLRSFQDFGRGSLTFCRAVFGREVVR